MAARELAHRRARRQRDVELAVLVHARRAIRVPFAKATRKRVLVDKHIEARERQQCVVALRNQDQITQALIVVEQLAIRWIIQVAAHNFLAHTMRRLGQPLHLVVGLTVEQARHKRRLRLDVVHKRRRVLHVGERVLAPGDVTVESIDDVQVLARVFCILRHIASFPQYRNEYIGERVACSDLLMHWESCCRLFRQEPAA